MNFSKKNYSKIWILQVYFKRGAKSEDEKNFKD